MLRNILFVFFLVICMTSGAYANGFTEVVKHPDLQINVEYIQEVSIAKISWTCSSQSNIKLFVCEKSLDGIVFEEISRVLVDQTDYIEFDEFAIDDVQYYRVITYLQSGEEVVSAMHTVTKTITPVEVTATFYPSPVIEEVNILLTNHENQAINISLYNDNGDEILIEEENHIDKYVIDCRSLVAGSYFIRAQVGEDVFVEKIDIID